MTEPIVRKHILVVDDDPDITRMVQLMLEEEGYAVSRAHGTAQGMTMIKNSVPDLIVLDYMMPHLTGLELLNYVRRDPRTMGVPVIVYSALTTQDVRDLALKAEGTRYVPKTATPQEFVSIVRELLPNP